MPDNEGERREGVVDLEDHTPPDEPDEETTEDEEQAEGSGPPDDFDRESAWKAQVRLRRENERRRKENKELSEKAERLEKLEAEDRRRKEEEQKKAGEYDKIIEAKDQELAGLKSQIEELKPIRDSYNEMVDARRAELLERLPKKLREDYAEFDLPVLEKVVRDFVSVTTQNGSPGNEAPTQRGAKPEKLSDLSQTQLAELLKTDPETARRLMREAGRN